MVFKLREAAGGMAHLRLKWERVLLRRPDDFFLRRYKSGQLAVDRFVDHNGEFARCEVCGYAFMRVTLNTGWLLETCSAMPAIPPFQSDEFEQWLASLPQTKLPTTCV